MKLTPQELVERGFAVEAMYAGEYGVKEFCDTLITGYLRDIQQSDPAEKFEREQLYQRIKTVEDLMQLMEAAIGAGRAQQKEAQRNG